MISFFITFLGMYALVNPLFLSPKDGLDLGGEGAQALFSFWCPFTEL